MQSKVFETSETVDYSTVINYQLNRIAEIRSRIHKYALSESFNIDYPYVAMAREYLAAVETLYVLLLPDLRGRAKKYLDLAREIFSILQKNKPSEEDRERIQEIYEELPDDLKPMQKGHYYVGLFPLPVIDAILSTLIEELNAAGLLMRGKTITVGVVNVSSKPHKEGLQV